MKNSVCWLIFALVACGKSERDSDAEQLRGGTTAEGGVASATASGGSGASAGNLSTSGEAGALGGVTGSSPGGSPASAGFAADAGGGSEAGGVSGSGNEGGSSVGGEAGSAGAAGAPSFECAGEYVACGCGCCGGVTPQTVCYYPDRGDSLAAIQSEDQELAMNPECANAGCSLGVHYACCATPSDSPGAASYEASGAMVSSDLYRASIYRTGADDRCQFVHIARGDGPPSKEFPIALPDGWILEVLTDSACEDKNSADASKHRAAIGGLGSLGFARAGSECTLEFDFTLFFSSTNGQVDAVRFQSDGLPGPSVPECE